MVMDADSALDPGFVRHGLAYLASGRHAAVGGTFTGKPGGGLVGMFQRNEYARYARDVRRLGGKALVLTGTATIFRAATLQEVVAARGERRLPGLPHVYVPRLSSSAHHEAVDRFRVMGVDACRTGWIGVVLTGGAPIACHATEIGDLAATAARDAPLDVIAVDIPIGLADTGRRRADELAREAAGPRWASVFMTPVRTALRAADYATAARESRRICGTGISAQSYALRGKILQVDRWIRRAGTRVVEAHPEVCFAEMAALSGGPLTAGKKSWAGMRQRAALLARQGIDLPADLGEPGALAGADDVLDAAAAAWTARRVARGEARSLPDPPQVFSDGLPCAIWV
ncbi:hypothetical protein GCM10022214_64110 [Actinomadura miaoliensis]|uniref:DUF429 domain-containing protein n=2 Tax=Actinomadura miaoliensis TaxID=430685 RepID=A0ABP7WPC8_9ACTN